MTRFKNSKITVNQFAILKDQLPSTDDINLSTNLSFKYSLDSQQIACIAEFKFNSNNDLFLLLSCQCNFVIHPDDWQEFVKEGNVKIPHQLLVIFAEHTVGTSRGILFCKTEGTVFASLIIPHIDVSDLMQDDSR